MEPDMTQVITDDELSQLDPASQTEAPKQEQTEAQPAVEEKVETPAQAPVEETSTTSEVVESPSTEDVDEDPELPQWQPQNIDINQLPRDPENPDYVDPQAYAQAIQQQAIEAARREIAEQRQEEKLWDKATEAYPELKENKDLRDLVYNSRMGEMIAGRNPSPKAVADRLFKHIQSARQSGVQQAQTNVTVQESARLETSNTRSNDNAVDRSGLMGQLSSYDARTKDAAVDALLKDMFDSGDLKLPQ